jgi:hypothetical protein
VRARPTRLTYWRRRAVVLGTPVLLLGAGVGWALDPAGASSPPRPAPTPVFGPVAPPPAPLQVGPTLEGTGLRPAPVTTPAPPPDPDAAALDPATTPQSPPQQVAVLQRLLNRRTGSPLAVDGDWGPATTRALEQVQAAAGLPATGRLDARTAALLRTR